ncbi:MAG: amidohydrolase [Bacteroidota bacterium]
MKDLHVSLLQTDIVWEDRVANLNHLDHQLSALPTTDLIVLPEMFTSGFSMNAAVLAETNNGPTLQWMKTQAKAKDAAVTGSFIIEEEGQFYNRLFFVYPNGKLRSYDKKHLFALAGEDKIYVAGSDRLILEYRGWKIALMICYDLRFPVWSRATKYPDHRHEYDLLIYVANWPSPRILAWDSLLRARAIENLSFCLGVNRVGEDAAGKKYPGHSAIYDYCGERLSYLEDKEGTVSAKIERESLNSFRARFPFQQDADSFEINP